MYDLCVVGHLTKDIIKIKGNTFENIGGVAYYFSVSAKKLGLNVSVCTKVKKEDEKLIEILEKEEVKVFWKESKETTIFENIYEESLDKRRQRVLSVADPINYEDLKEIDAKIFHFGPLISGDISLDIYKKVKKEKNAIVTLDVQGHLRFLKENGEIYFKPLGDISFLKYIDILKCNEEEIKVLGKEKNILDSLEKVGKYVNEIVVTLGSKGSLIYYNGEIYRIPVFSPRKIVDVTGCGDTYFSAYVFMRYRGFKPKEAGLFASIVAGLKIEKKGVWIGIKPYF